MIKSGYLLIVSSWENDGDNGRDKLVAGLSNEDIQFYVELFKKTHRYQNESALSAKEVLKCVHPTVCKWLDQMSEDTRSFWTYEGEEDPEDEALADFYCEGIEDHLTGYTTDYQDERYFIRRIESYKVYYLPQDLTEIMV